MKYFKNTSWLFGEKILRMIVGLFVGIWVARYLGPEQFGLFSYAQSFVGLFAAFATLGLDGIVVRELIKDASKRDELIATAFWLKVMGAFGVLLLLGIAVNFTSNDDYTNLLVFIIASATIFQSFNVIDFYFQSKVISRYVVYANIISLFLSSIIKVALILNEAPLIAFAWVILFDSFVLACGFVYFYIYNSNHFAASAEPDWNTIGTTKGILNQVQDDEKDDEGAVILCFDTESQGILNQVQDGEKDDERAVIPCFDMESQGILNQVQDDEKDDEKDGEKDDEKDAEETLIQNLKFKKSTAISLLKDSWPLIFSAIVISIYMKIDQVMIKEMLDNQAVGQYAAAVRISELWYFIPMVIASSLFPAIISSKKQSEELYYTRLQKLYDMMVIIAIAIALPMTFLSNWIIDLLYGDAFYEAGNILMIHIWTGIFVFLSVSSGKFLIAENMIMKALYRNLSAVIINIILNIYLIELYGINGAAIATLISWIISGYLYDLFDKEMRFMFIQKTKSLVGYSIIKNYKNEKNENSNNHDS